MPMDGTSVKAEVWEIIRRLRRIRYEIEDTNSAVGAAYL